MKTFRGLCFKVVGENCGTMIRSDRPRAWCLEEKINRYTRESAIFKAGEFAVNSGVFLNLFQAVQKKQTMALTSVALGPVRK